MAEPEDGELLITDAPEAPIDRVVGPLARFLHVEAASGVVLIGATLVALVLANSAASDAYLAIWKTKLTLGLGTFQMEHSLRHWISDGLMALFFFVVGLEVKRELVVGELRDLKRAALPIAAAIGGMIAPAAIYLSLQWGTPSARGWGIPMATDIAFVVGCLAVLGSRVPQSLRVLLLSLAIADDIGAILVIAIGYTKSLNLLALVLGFVGVGAVIACERLGVRSIGVYFVLGGGVWLGFHESGVHATIAGVILGLLTPTGAWVSESAVSLALTRAGFILRGGGLREGLGPVPRKLLGEVKMAAVEAIPPLVRLETALHPWSSFAIMPLFALANAGVVIRPDYFGDPIAVAVMLGLLVGKPLGIVTVSWLAVRAGVAKLPDGIGWGVMVGAGLLAGIGFTMSLFIAGLALEGSALSAAKIGILEGSLMSGVAGMVALLLLLPKPDTRASGPAPDHP